MSSTLDSNPFKNAYQPFDVGDKVWSEQFGFCTITEVDAYNNAVRMSKDGVTNNGLWLSSDGKVYGYTSRPRTIFHAVADTDDDMREAIKCGHGLFRRAPVGGLK